NPRALAAKVAAALGGTAVEHAAVSGFLSSEFDPFLNQLFASGRVAPRDAAEALEGRPGFVWLVEAPDRDELAQAEAERLLVGEMLGMTATTEPPSAPPPHEGELGEGRSRTDLAGWHEVYW